jgi:CBS domain-containing protein
LLKHKISGAPVVDDKGSLVGILSELDCVNHMCHRATENLPPLDVHELMTRDVVTIAPQASLLTLADLFAKKRYRRFPVVDEDGRLIGQVSRRDLLRALNDIMRKRTDDDPGPLYLSAIHDEAPAKVR